VPERPEVLLADANVLIDYVDTEIEILALAAIHLGTLIVPRPVLDQVPRLSLRDCSRLRISVLEPETEIQVKAGERSAALGFRDTLCLVLCETNGWTCVTNDAALLKACRRSGVQVRRGLNLMIELADRGYLDIDRALSVARAIGALNSFITDTILQEFEAALRGR
jgi:rRNA-processing protein FCF1